MVTQITTGYANKINSCSSGSELDNFAQREADALGIPFEFVRTAVYTQPKGSQHLYFGQGQVSILAVLAEKHGLGILEFGDPKFRMLDLATLLECQEAIRNRLFGVAKTDEEVGSIADYHRLSLAQIDPMPDPENIEALQEFAKKRIFVFFNKKKPAIHSCVLPYKVRPGENYVSPFVTGANEGQVEYVIDYSLTNVTQNGGAGYHVIPTMVTRAKKIAYEKAFGLNPSFFMKACKMDVFSEFRAENVIDSKDSKEKSEERHKRKLANIDDSIAWENLPTVIEAN